MAGTAIPLDERSCGEGGVRKWQIMILSIGLLVLAAYGWRYTERHWCSTDGWFVSDTEMKGRALLAVMKKGEQHLSQNMSDLLAEKLPEGGSDGEIRAVLTDYVRAYPLCCQMDYEDRGHHVASARDRPWPEFQTLDWIGNLIIFDGPEVKFFTLDELNQYRDGRRRHPGPGVGLHTVAGTNACGDQVILWSRG